MALLDGGSVLLDLTDGDGHAEHVRLDMEMGSPTEGKVFASMFYEEQPLSAEEEKKLLILLLNVRTDTENHQWHLKMVTDHLSGTSQQTGDALSKRDIDELLQDI